MQKALTYIIVFILVQLMATYAVLTVASMLDGHDFVTAVKAVVMGGVPGTATLLIITSAVYSVILLVMFLSRKWCVASPTYLRTKPWGVFFWAGVAALGTLIPSEVYQELLPLPDFSTQELMQVMSSRWGYLTICIFAPLVEEVVFRGAVLRSLLQRMNSRWGAIALSALFFALVHLNPAQMPHAFLIGLLLGWMYERTRSILPGIMVHWVNNTVVYVVYNLLPNLSERPVYDLFGGDWKRIALSVLFSLLILLPALWQLHTRMKPAQEEIFPKYE